jgi:hypothetical protein
MKTKFLLNKVTLTGIILLFIQLLSAGWVMGQSMNRPPVAYPLSDVTLLAQNHSVLQTANSGNNEDVFSASTIQNGGDRLVATQNTDGGWGWELSGPSEPNTIGPIAKGLIQAYGYSFSASQLDAITKSRTYLLNKTNTFSPSDGYLAKALDEVFGGTTCRDHMNTYFYGLLATNSYYRSNGSGPYSTATYVQLIRDNRASQGIPNLAAWDVGLGLVGAASCGASTYDWVAGVKAEIEELNLSDYYDVIGLAGGLYGLAFVHATFNPAFGPYASAENLQDLANFLESYQINNGGFAWNSGYVSSGNETNQETSYAILALSELNRTGFIMNILGAADYLGSVQLPMPSGGWDNYPGDPYGENNELTAEALWGYSVAFSKVENYTKGTWHMTIQAAINAAGSGDVIKVYPGNYNETAPNSFFNGATYQFGLFFTASKSNITVEGCKADGTPVTNTADIAAFITTNATNTFGYSGTMVAGDNITLRGLEFGSNTPSDDKAIEVVGNGFTIDACRLTADAPVYIGDYNYNENGTPGDFSDDVSSIQSYTISNCHFAVGDVYIANGAGWTGATPASVIGRSITGCTFEGWAIINFSGYTPGTAWLNYPTGAATITSNSFINTDPGNTRYVQSWGVVQAQFPYASYWNDNTFPKKTITTTDGNPDNVRGYDVSPYYNLKRIGNVIQPRINYALTGDVILVGAGTYSEQIHVALNNLTIQGSGKTYTFIKSPATLALSFSTPGVKKPVVFIDGVANCTLNDLTVDGDGKGNANNSFIGVAFWNAGGTLSNVNVINVKDTPFSGAQHGVGIYAYNNTISPTYSITLNQVSVSEFQKNALALNGDGDLIVDLDNVTVIGKGATGVTAQNGIQVWGGSGTINDCNISQIAYTGSSWTASGLLIYGPGTITADNVDIDNCQTSVYWQDAEGSYKNSSITNPLMDAVYGYSSSGSHNFTVDNVIATGSDISGSWGISPLANGGTINMTITKCTVTHFDYGIYAYKYAAPGGVLNTIANYNNIYLNNYGFATNGTTVQDATFNWWGDATGPYHPVTNVCGLGNDVTDYVNYSPWYTNVYTIPSPPTRTNNTYKISGAVKYANNANTPLNGILVTLKKGGSFYASYNTNLTPGSYEFTGLTNDSYDLELSSYPGGSWVTWGGVNNTDYLLVLRHAGTGPYLPVNPPVIQVAANVKAPLTSGINTIDAAAIRTAGTSGWAAGNFDIPKWVFSGPTSGLTGIVLNCANVPMNILGLCAGDVNASYLPVSGPKSDAQPNLQLINSGSIASASEIIIPVKADMDMELGAITLFLDYDASQFEITGVTMPKQGNDSPYFLTQNSVVQIGWASLEPVSVAMGETVLFIHGKVRNSNPGMIRFTLDGNPLSELADGEGNVINEARLKIADIGGSASNGMISVYPNPAKDVLNIEYIMDEAGTFHVELRNVQGAIVGMIDNTSKPAGVNMEKLNVSSLPAGVYMLRVSLGENLFTKKIVVNK